MNSIIFAKKFVPIADLEVDEDTVGHITFFKNKKLAYFRERATILGK